MAFFTYFQALGNTAEEITEFYKILIFQKMLMPGGPELFCFLSAAIRAAQRGREGRGTISLWDSHQE